MDDWIDEHVDPAFSQNRKEAMRLLQEEAELEEIVRLVGVDALSAPDRLVLEVARSIREDYLHQNAFHDVDTFTSLYKQYRLLGLIVGFYHAGQKAIGQGAKIDGIIALDVLSRIGRAKYVEESNVDAEYTKIEEEMAGSLPIWCAAWRNEKHFERSVFLLSG